VLIWEILDEIDDTVDMMSSRSLECDKVRLLRCTYSLFLRRRGQLGTRVSVKACVRDSSRGMGQRRIDEFAIARVSYARFDRVCVMFDAEVWTRCRIKPWDGSKLEG
jgi:hypothetical protein